MPGQFTFFIFQIVFCSVYCMSGVLNTVRRHLTTMAAEYVAGTYSMAFVTVPNEEVAAKLSRCVINMEQLFMLPDAQGQLEIFTECLFIYTNTSLESYC